MPTRAGLRSEHNAPPKKRGRAPKPIAYERLRERDGDAFLLDLCTSEGGADHDDKDGHQ